MPATPQWTGFSFKGFRSFVDMATIGPLTKVNVIAGQNNSGKTSVLELIRRIPSPSGDIPTADYSTVELHPIDAPQHAPAAVPLTIGLPANEAMLSTQMPDYDRRIYEQLIATMRRKNDNGLPLIPMLGQQRMQPDPGFIAGLMEDWPSWNPEFDQVFRRMVHSGQNGPTPVMTQLVKMVRPMQTTPLLHHIDGKRSATAFDPTIGTMDGDDLATRIAQLISPHPLDWNAGRDRYQRLNTFIRSILDDPTAELLVPWDRSTLMLRTAAMTLPINNLGAGVEQLIVLAAEVSSLSGHLVLMEEPEVGMHPAFQRRLLRYLIESTDNQYVIATHSAHLIDEAGTTVFHVAKEDGSSSVRLAKRAGDLKELFSDLGYWPSDLLQANSVIWVEGPSDRIYLSRWLHLAAPDLIERVHFSIMFYGGALLKHLTTDDEAADDFIHLSRINQHSAVLLDSDRNAADAQINATKQRVLSEFADGPGQGWMTAGSTIENYVPAKVLAAAVGNVHPQTTGLNYTDPFVNPFVGKSIDKIAVAQQAASQLSEPDLDQLDLRERVAELVRFIRRSNAPSSSGGGSGEPGEQDVPS